MEGRLGNGQAVGGMVRGMGSKKAILLVFFAALAGNTPAYPQVFGERPMRYGITSNFFNYDNRDDQRDFPTNGTFPGNFATSPFFASVGAAGWLGFNPQHSAAPYPSQSYFVVEGQRLACPRGYSEQTAAVTSVRPRHRRILCVLP
jgi:hypothetical protein